MLHTINAIQTYYTSHTPTKHFHHTSNVNTSVHYSSKWCPIFVEGILANQRFKGLFLLLQNLNDYDHWWQWLVVVWENVWR